MSTFTFVKAVKRKEKLRLALDGTAGSGKTWTALILATFLAKQEGGRVAVIDSERSSARKYASDFDFDHLTLPDFNPHTYMGAIRAAIAAGYPVLVIDSFSHAWEGVLQFKDDVTARSKSKNSYTEGWREATPVHNELVDTVLRADAHVIATLRTKTEYVIDDGKPTKVGMKPIQRDGVDFEFDVVGDMTPENSLIVSKTRCSKLAGVVIRKPDERLAETLWEWLNDGEEMLGPAEVEAIKDALNAAGKPARRAWLDRFGMKPDDFPAARRDEALAFVASLDMDTTEGAGDDGSDRGGDAGSGSETTPATGPLDAASSDGAHSHDVGRTEPEPAPATTGNGEGPALHGPSPEPHDDRPIDARSFGIRAQAVFEAAVPAEKIPRGRKTWLLKALRHALIFASTEGEATGGRDADGEQLYVAWGLLDDIEAGRVTFEFNASPTGAVRFTWVDGNTTEVRWSELTIAEAEAEVDRRAGAA